MFCKLVLPLPVCVCYLLTRLRANFYCRSRLVVRFITILRLENKGPGALPSFIFTSFNSLLSSLTVLSALQFWSQSQVVLSCASTRPWGTQSESQLLRYIQKLYEQSQTHNVEQSRGTDQQICMVQHFSSLILSKSPCRTKSIWRFQSKLVVQRKPIPTN